MEHARGKLIGKRGLRLSYGQWYPTSEPKAVALVVHGYGEHIGRYQHVIDALVEREYAVFAIDHRGHGQSEGDRACVERFDYFIQDLHLLVREARDAHPSLPRVMVGHSMGALIATRYALRYGEELDLLVLSGIALQIGDDVPAFVKKIGSVLSTVLPSFPVGEIGKNTLSRDPEVDRRINADPLHYRGKMKARMGHEMLQAAMESRTRVHQMALPVLIMHGENDKVTNPAGSKFLYETVGSSDKTLKIWDANLHEIFNELEKERIIAYMIDWLDERLASLPATQQKQAATQLP
ncbi:MAG: alpha/beta hydrolase [Ardenticatenales bacterium]|nr:alpha/beta hydrolase [Ardenticatenales bacterium]